MLSPLYWKIYIKKKPICSSSFIIFNNNWTCNNIQDIILWCYVEQNMDSYNEGIHNPMENRDLYIITYSSKKRIRTIRKAQLPTGGVEVSLEKVTFMGNVGCIEIESKHSKSMQGKICFRGGVKKRKKSGNIKLLHSNRN